MSHILIHTLIRALTRSNNTARIEIVIRRREMDSDWQDDLCEVLMR